MKRADELADGLLEHARNDQDIEAAVLLRRLGRVGDLAFDLVRAKTHHASMAAFDALKDEMMGKQE